MTLTPGPSPWKGEGRFICNPVFSPLYIFPEGMYPMNSNIFTFLATLTLAIVACGFNVSIPNLPRPGPEVTQDINRQHGGGKRDHSD